MRLGFKSFGKDAAHGTKGTRGRATIFYPVLFAAAASLSEEIEGACGKFR